MWGYKHNNIVKEFATREELVNYLDAMDPGVLRYVRYWYIDNNFVPQDVLYDLVDGCFTGVTSEDWLDDALDAVEDAFTSGDYDWTDETIEGIYYREEEE